jgi:hypothetical protein
MTRLSLTEGVKVNFPLAIAVSTAIATIDAVRHGWYDTVTISAILAIAIFIIWLRSPRSKWLTCVQFSLMLISFVFFLRDFGNAVLNQNHAMRMPLAVLYALYALVLAIYLLYFAVALRNAEFNAGEQGGGNSHPDVN